MRMNLKNNIMEELNILGKEFWGILLFETNIKSLFEYLKIDKEGVSLTSFANWMVFPEFIPPDLRNKIKLALLHRHENDEYKKIFAGDSDVQLTEDEIQLQEHTNELIRFKYSNQYVQPDSFKYLYGLSKNAFEHVLEQFMKTGYTDNDTIILYHLYYSSRNREGLP